MSSFSITRPDEIFSDCSRMGHSVMPSQRVIPYSVPGNSQVGRWQRSRADHMEVCFREHRGGQSQIGDGALKRREVQGLCSKLSGGGGAVTPMVESLYITPCSAIQNSPLCSLLRGKEVRA